MVILDIKGRLGNALFELSEAIYIANLKHTELRILHNAHSSFEEIYKEFIGNYKLIEEKEFDRSKFKKLKRRNGISNDGKIDESSIANTKNVIIEDYFLGRSYVHDELIRDIFVPSESLREEILELYAPTRNSLSMHIRRGDFLWSTYTKRGWHSCTKEYWETAYTLTGKEYDKVFILSDDLDWCKNTLNIPGNVVSVERKKNLKQYLDKASVYALNTLVCQLYELYLEYPTSFKSFDLIDVKENYEDYFFACLSYRCFLLHLLQVFME